MPRGWFLSTRFLLYGTLYTSIKKNCISLSRYGSTKTTDTTTCNNSHTKTINNYWLNCQIGYIYTMFLLIILGYHVYLFACSLVRLSRFNLLVFVFLSCLYSVFCRVAIPRDAWWNKLIYYSSEILSLLYLRCVLSSVDNALPNAIQLRSSDAAFPSKPVA